MVLLQPENHIKKYGTTKHMVPIGQRSKNLPSGTNNRLVTDVQDFC